jgi:hypothetical protein
MKTRVLVKLIILGVVVLSVVSCAQLPSTRGYTKLMDSWVGSSEASVISQWGVPDSSYSSGTTKYITYRSQRSFTIPGRAPTYRTHCSGYSCTSTPSGGSSAYTSTSRCETTFVINGGRVSSYSFKGNACRQAETESGLGDFMRWMNTPLW